jgi:16S rRNA (cytidine1402-2'-O)-methyltransferase
MAGTLFVVATPIGNLEDISARALRTLREVALIAAEDTRHTGQLLQRFGIPTRTTSFHEHSEKGKAIELLNRLRAGDSIALVSDAGTPGVSDPGSYLVRMAHEAGIAVEAIPGPSAVVTALSAAGIPFSSFVFLGFPPTRSSERGRWLDRLEHSVAVADVAVFYEAPHRIQQTLNDLHVRFGAIELCLARELTKAHQSLSIHTLPFGVNQERGEFTVVVNLGSMTKSAVVEAPGREAIAVEFGDMTNIGGLTRRQAISSLSRKYRMTARDIYAMLEAAKNSVG